MPRQIPLLSRRVQFSTGRVLGLPFWTAVQNHEFFGPDARPHGDEYTLDIAFAGLPDAIDGMIVNLSDLKPALARAVAPLENRLLEMGAPPFLKTPPTLENISLLLWNALPQRLGGGEKARLCLAQSGRAALELLPDTMIVSRKYEFAAAHRLHTDALSPDENFSRFNKCSNINGHGHNYGLCVGVSGTPDAQTGTVISPALLDKIVDEEIFARFDHKFLNLDCPEFEGIVPTSENFALLIFDLLEKRLKSQGFTLAKIGLNETQKNYFEVTA